MEKVADRVKTILRETGLSEAAIAAKTNGVITQQGINKIKGGITKQPSAEALAAIARATGYRFEWLADNRGPKKEGGAVNGHHPQPPKSRSGRAWRRIIETIVDSEFQRARIEAPDSLVFAITSRILGALERIDAGASAEKIAAELQAAEREVDDVAAGSH